MMNSKISGRGFTLVELLIAMAVSGILMTGVYSAFKTQQDSYLAQEQVAEVQQNMRASMDFITRDLRMAGFDPTESGNFSITDVRSRDLDNALDASGNPAITFQVDLNEDGALDTNESFSYSLYEYPATIPADQDGIVDLAREIVGSGSGRQLLGESIIAMGFAYSYVDDNEEIVTDAASVDINGDGAVNADDQVTVWAIDTGIDNNFNINIDTNKDGIIDINDNPAGAALPAAILPTPNIQNIVAVKVWLLAQVRQPDRNFQETKTFVVANQRITPNDNNRHRLMEMTVQCRNLGL